jgi:coenzyme F420-reducing hydrogenase gamma subunit
MAKENKLPRVAIYDLTDCEGCEVELISLREKLLEIEKRVEIVNWRLAQSDNQDGLFDITLVEGCPITQSEIDLLKSLREKSGKLIGLGSCATLGGIPAIVDEKERKKWYNKIYGEKYKPKGIDALPLSAYVKVDFLIHGCPVDGGEVIRIMEELLAGKEPKYRPYSVCFDCKLAGNECRILHNKPCLGPITQGGCGAICIKGGSPCYGCFGIREEASIKRMKEIIREIGGEKTVERYFSMFLNKSNE